MRVVTNPIMTNEACAAVYGTTVVNADVICIDTTGGRGTCDGDNGGVLSVPHVEGGAGRTQIGFFSFGSSAGCQSGFPAGFGRVSTQLGWIHAHMN